MLEEAPVLCGDERVHHVQRYVVELHEHAPLFTDLLDQPAVAAEDPERDLQRDVADRFRLGQRRRHIIIGTDHAGDAADAGEAAQAQ